MRRITYFENMRGKLNQVTREELEAFKGYENARKCNLEYPILSDLMFVDAGKVAEIYTSVRIGKFILATASTSGVDNVAQLFLRGYKVVDVVNLSEFLGDNIYMTCCKLGLLIGKR